MLDDFFEGFSRSLGWFFGHVVGHLLFKAGYWVGWPFVKCITLGYCAIAIQEGTPFRKKYGRVVLACLF